MPRLARVTIKTAMIYLAGALLLSALIAASGAFRFSLGVNGLQPVAVHLLIVGWLSQLVFGVAYWMFPKQSKERPRGDDRLGWAMYLLLNSGLILRAAGEPLYSSGGGFGWLLPVSALLQWGAAMLFIVNTWTRVKER